MNYSYALTLPAKTAKNYLLTPYVGYLCPKFAPLIVPLSSFGKSETSGYMKFIGKSSNFTEEMGSDVINLSSKSIFQLKED